MGMVLSLCSVSDQNIERIVADPPLIWQVVSPDDPEPYQAARARGASTSWLGRLLKRSPEAPAPLPPDLILLEGEGATVDLDKSWHGLHFLLTGSGEPGPPPMSFLLDGGRAAGNEDLGFGPPRLLAAEDVRAIQSAVSRVAEDDLRRRYDPAAMAAHDVYLKDMWSRLEDREANLGYLLEYFTVLREFLGQAVDRRLGMAVYLS